MYRIEQQRYKGEELGDIEKENNIKVKMKNEGEVLLLCLISLYPSTCMISEALPGVYNRTIDIRVNEACNSPPREGLDTSSWVGVNDNNKTIYEP